MAKNKISEFSSTPANNTDISGINIAEGCAPSGINNAIRELMAQLKDQQSGTDGDNFTVGGNLTVAGTSEFTGVATFTAVPVIPSTIGFVPTGVIVMWSGSIASIPSGWLLCDGTSGTPNLRDKFIVGAGSTYAVAAAGGSADAVVVSHTHTQSAAGASTGSVVASPSGDFGAFTSATGNLSVSGAVGNRMQGAAGTGSKTTLSISVPDHTHTINSTGDSGTNANLPPYYALAYIIKS